MRILICLAAVCLAGCQQQPSLGTVSGRVTCNGKPVTDARIVFQRDDGWSVFAVLDAEGRFKVRTHDAGGLTPGKYLVAVRPAARVNESDVVVGMETPQTPRPDVPERFRSHETSKLVAIVKEGANPPFDFVLDDD